MKTTTSYFVFKANGNGYSRNLIVSVCPRYAAPPQNEFRVRNTCNFDPYYNYSRLYSYFSYSASNDVNNRD